MPLSATWIDAEISILSEESQTDGLVKETSPHEGTGPRAGAGAPKADFLLVRAARGLGRLTQKH